MQDTNWAVTGCKQLKPVLMMKFSPGLRKYCALVGLVFVGFVGSQYYSYVSDSLTVEKKKESVSHFDSSRDTADLKDEASRNTADLKDEATGKKQMAKNVQDGALITLFTTVNFGKKDDKWNEEIFLNTLKNWRHLGSGVNVVVFSDDKNLKDMCQNEGFDVLSIPKAVDGRPIFKNMYIEIMNKYNSQFYSYVYPYVLFEATLTKLLSVLSASTFQQEDKPILLVGGSVDVNVDKIDLKARQTVTWDGVQDKIKSKGRSGFFLYFMTSKGYPWSEFPELVVNSAKIDNYILWNARKNNHVTIDVTNVLMSMPQLKYQAGDNYNENLIAKLTRGVVYGAGGLDCTEYMAGIDFNTGTRMVFLKRFPKMQSCCRYDAVSKYEHRIC